MSTSIPLNRLASSSRCLQAHVARLAPASLRTYATESTPPLPPSAPAHAPAPNVTKPVASLASRLRHAGKQKSRPLSQAASGTPTAPPVYPENAVATPQRLPLRLAAKKARPHTQAASRPPVAPLVYPENAVAIPQRLPLRHAAKKDPRPHTQPAAAASPTAPLVHPKNAVDIPLPSFKVMPRVPEVDTEKKTRVNDVLPRRTVYVEGTEENVTLGPGFIFEGWTDYTNQTDQPHKAPPPHVLPAEEVTRGAIDTGTALVDVDPISEHLPVAKLAHGLDRVLFNPGVHWLQDPRSHVYNFTPWLEKIPKVNDFAFERLTGFISSSRDEDLRALAKQEGKKFAGSTSSLSGMLTHIYFLISRHKDVELTTLSQHFTQENPTFTSGQRMPASVKLIYKDGVYAIDALGSELDDPDKNVLTWMGTLLENFLTKTPTQFNKFWRAKSAATKESNTQPMREAYRFAKSNKFVMRSQLDCHDPRLPGTGVFDIKTRAAVSIRMDILNYEENSGYMIKNQFGLMESFEREYYDLIRSAFLKYSFQVRIGNMDGVMVAYHNTERIFGFQYISLDEMDERIYGPIPGIGEKVFNKSVTLLEAVLENATKCYPDQTITCLFETRRPGHIMDVYVQPVEWDKSLGKKPVTQLLVEVDHQLDGKRAKSFEVLKSESPQNWTMEYTISKTSLPAEIIGHNLTAAEKRKTRQRILPSSVELKDAKTYWEKLSFNPKLELVAKAFRQQDFVVADNTIELFREVSRRGREVYQELQRRQEGKPKIILGHGVHAEEESLFFKDPVRVAPAEEATAAETQAVPATDAESASEETAGTQEAVELEAQPEEAAGEPTATVEAGQGKEEEATDRAQVEPEKKE